MRLTAAFLLAATIHVSAGSFAQKVNLSVRNQSLGKVFSLMSRQTGYSFFCDEQLIQAAGTVSLTAKDRSLDETLKDFLSPLSLTFEIRTTEKAVFIRNKLPEVTIDINLPPGTVHGKVTSQDGEPLPGVVVSFGHSQARGRLSHSAAVQTDKDGYFSIASEGDSLHFTSVGYKSRTIFIGNNNSINVVLERSVSVLDQVVVNKGYYTTSERFNTGSVTTVTSKDLEKQPVSNVLLALEGLVPGLLITQPNGVPGATPTVQLRGQNSVLNGSEPLYLVDGVPFSSDALSQVLGFDGVSPSAAGLGGLSPLNSLNIADIESIDVLKDADATAIYGSRAANGVILITTKKGKAGPTRVDFTAYSGFNKLSRLQPYMSTQQYLQMRRQAFANDNSTPGPLDYDLNGTWDSTRNVNWGKELIGHASHTTNGELSVSGGDDKSQYLVGVGYNRVTPPYDGNFSDNRKSAHFSITTNSNNRKFRMTFGGSYSEDDNNLPGFDVANYLNLPPDAPSMKNPDGTLNWPNLVSNPYAQLLDIYHASSKVLISNGQLSYQLIPGLQVKSTFGYTNTQYTESLLTPSTSISPNSLIGSSSSFSTSNPYTWIIEPQASYKRRISQGMLDLLAGGTFQNNLTQGQVTNATGFPSDNALNNLAAASTVKATNSYDKYRYAAAFGRINYTWDEKYILNLTGRRDGSSRFGENNRFSNFGAAGAAWIFSEEGLVKKNLPWLSFGKLRGSYGITGNDQIGDYNYLASYSATSGYSYQGLNGSYITRAANPNYTWESNRKLEAAVELGLLKDRITLTADWFRNRSSNQLVTTPLAPTTGNQVVTENRAALVQNTGYEFMLRTRNVTAGAFSWTSALNLSITRNKLISYPGLAESPYSNLFIVGKPLTIQQVFHLDGVDTQTGLYQFASKTSQTGVTSSPDYTADRTKLLDLTPRYYGGFVNTFQYKGFQAEIFMHFVKQKGRNVRYGGTQVTTNAPGSMSNLPSFFLDNVWQKPGDKAQYQKFSTGSAASSTYSYASESDAAYTDASFIRCQNVSLSYSFNQKILHSLHIPSARIYANAQNVFTITGYKGSDPEAQGTVLPLLKTYTFGIQFSL